MLLKSLTDDLCLADIGVGLAGLGVAPDKNIYSGLVEFFTS